MLAFESRQINARIDYYREKEFLLSMMESSTSD